ncbi:hypothetical protein GW830_01360 [bacterium]|nr:hypothetical protein [bacterium]
MNSIRLLDNLFQISINEDFSEENEQYFIWIGEFLSMFDFLWNHSELFMEIINVPTIETGGISGSYNTVYAQFLKHSFEERKKFKEILTTAHEGDILDLLSKRETITFMEEERRFCEYNRCPVALIHWHHLVYPHEMVP